MSTATLQAAVEIATATATRQVAGILAHLDGCGVFTLATADTVLADLAAAESTATTTKHGRRRRWRRASGRIRCCAL